MSLDERRRGLPEVRLSRVYFGRGGWHLDDEEKGATRDRRARGSPGGAKAVDSSARKRRIERYLVV